MILLICQDRPAGQNYHPTHFIKGEQLFKLTAIDLKGTLINEMFENPISRTPFRALMYKITSPSSSGSMRSPTHVELAPFKKGTKPDDPPQNVDISHLGDPSSTTTILDETYPLDTACDHLLHSDSPSLSSELQDMSSGETVEIEFIDESEEPLEINKPSPTDVFSSYHEYDLFLFTQQIDTPSDNLNFQNTHVCENEDAIIIHATKLSHTFELPQFMAEHNCEYLNPTDTPITVPTAIQATSDQPSNPWCAHDLMATQCNQSQYPNPNHNVALPQFMTQLILQVQYQPLSIPPVITSSIQMCSQPDGNPVQPTPYPIPLNKICAHIQSASQRNQVSLSNSLASPYPPGPGEHVLKRSATATGEQDFPVNWFKFIHPSPKPRMTETPIQKPVNVAYSPIASMNYQWTINIHDGYPLLQGMQPEEYIPPTLHTLSNHKPTMFHLNDDYLCTTKILAPWRQWGESGSCSH